MPTSLFSDGGKNVSESLVTQDFFTDRHDEQSALRLVLYEEILIICLFSYRKSLPLYQISARTWNIWAILL
jgi:hypothetical protein